MRSLVFSAFLVFILGFQAPGEAVNKTKLILGSCLIAGGAALSIHSAETSVLGEPGEGHFEFNAGIALAGVGATFLVLGLIQKDNNQNRELIVPKEMGRETIIGVAPRRGGFSAGMIIRW